MVSSSLGNCLAISVKPSCSYVGIATWSNESSPQRSCFYQSCFCLPSRAWKGELSYCFQLEDRWMVPVQREVIILPALSSLPVIWGSSTWNEALWNIKYCAIVLFFQYSTSKLFQVGKGKIQKYKFYQVHTCSHAQRLLGLPGWLQITLWISVSMSKNKR